MKKQRFTLIELTTDLGMPIDDLIGFGADDELTIHVIADEWPATSASGTETVDGEVVLLPDDLIKGFVADELTLRKVRIGKNDIVSLDPPQRIRRGQLYVTAAERARIRTELESAATVELRKLEENQRQASPPYLDPSDENYSEKLAAAVGAWTALYADGGFRLGVADKKQIMDWLRDHHPTLSDTAQKQIATIVNPNEKGGNPKTRRR